jgi:hypothetical protein
MQRSLWIVAVPFGILFVTAAEAQVGAVAPGAVKPAKPTDACYVKPKDTTVVVPLQGGNLAYEPACAPYRIRVDDRKPVTIILKNVSPVEVCLPSSKAPTVTTATNPIESIVGTIAGFKSFEFASRQASVFDHEIGILSSKIGEIEAPPPAGAKPHVLTEDEKALKDFRETAENVYKEAKQVTDKQIKWQALYQKDLDDMVDYLNADYRGALWGNFDPDGEPDLQTLRDHKALASIDVKGKPGPNDPASELDYAPLQALIDEMKAAQTKMLASCSAGGKTCSNQIVTTTYELIDRANAILTVIGDNMKSLQTSQAAVATAFGVLHKMFADFNRKLEANYFLKDGAVLTQSIVLATDYGATDTGTISCSTDTSPAIATLDTVNYSVLYQNIPALTASAGLFITFLQKNQYGVQAQFNTGSVCTANCPGGTPTPTGTYTQYFALTDSARASVFPMAYVNYPIGPPKITRYWRQPNNELVITNNVSAGIGINSNTGTNQPEFYAGYAAGFSKLLLHAGLHYGRVESLGGGFTTGQPVPASWGNTAIPINWTYKPYFGIGFSVRVAPW